MQLHLTARWEEVHWLVVREEGGFKTVRQQDTKTKNKTINRIRKTRHTKDK